MTISASASAKPSFTSSCLIWLIKVKSESLAGILKDPLLLAGSQRRKFGGSTARITAPKLLPGLKPPNHKRQTAVRSVSISGTQDQRLLQRPHLLASRPTRISIERHEQDFLIAPPSSRS